MTAHTSHTRDVFIVCNNIEELGGLQRWAHYLARLLSERGHQVHLVGIVHPEELHDYGHDLPYRTSVLYEGEPPSSRWRPRKLDEYADVLSHARAVKRAVGMRRAASRLTAILRGARPGGIVIVPQVWAMEWVALADTAGLKVIAMSHESHEASRTSQRRRRALKLFPQADRVLLLTREDADLWIHEGLNNIDVMPNPLTLAPTSLSPRAANTVVTLGRLSFEKGFDLLLDAWAQVVPEHPDWRLRLYGSGPEEEDLRKRAADLGVAETVDFPGTTADVEGALRDASVFALSSRNEGFPVSMMEAMAMGVAVVACDCSPGVREVVEDGLTGLLVPAGNTEQLTAALARVIADKGLRDRLGEGAVAAVAPYAPEAVVDRWERMFDMVYR